MPGSPCREEKGMRGARTVDKGRPTHGENPLRSTASPELEPERRNGRDIRARKTQNAELRAPRQPGTIWHAVTVHVQLRYWIGRRRRRAAIHNALYSTQSLQPLIRSETQLSETPKSAPNKFSHAQERKNNSPFFSQPAVKIQKIIHINQSCSEIKE